MTKVDTLFNLFFNDQLKKRLESWVIIIASVGFVVHLALILLVNTNDIVGLAGFEDYLANPISAVYTPFSFILIYEVYLLIYYLPRSFAISIGKQFEIISLILIRRVFKDISKINVQSEVLFQIENLALLYDILGILVLFTLIFVYRYFLIKRKVHKTSVSLTKFRGYKKLLCLLLVPIFIGLASVSFVKWSIDIYHILISGQQKLMDFNTVFYHEFFDILIIVDVLILVASLKFTDRYSLIIRNTGFVITTVLLRVSFNYTGLENVVLMIGAVLFGVSILGVQLLYDKIDLGDSTKESYGYM
ncbi:MAG: hypothetical protein VX062_06870 [Bacteroidota bacterium]|nr:hypothetical protein [Bacteroidota bacterium]